MGFDKFNHLFKDEPTEVRDTALLIYTTGMSTWIAKMPKNIIGDFYIDRSHLNGSMYWRKYLFEDYKLLNQVEYKNYGLELADLTCELLLIKDEVYLSSVNSTKEWNGVKFCLGM